MFMYVNIDIYTCAHVYVYTHIKFSVSKPNFR